MNQLSAVRKLIRPDSSRSRIKRVLSTRFGEHAGITIAVLKASDAAAVVYNRKKRKNGDMRISHEDDMLIIAVVREGITCSALLVAIYMHDLHEDYRRLWQLYKIDFIFGRTVSQTVGAVTKPPLRGRNLVSLEYSQAVADKVNAGGFRAKYLKCIDRLDFLLKPYIKPDRITDEERLRLIWKVRQTMDHIIPMSIEIGKLTVELQLALADIIKTYNITSAELAAVAKH